MKLLLSTVLLASVLIQSSLASAAVCVADVSLNNRRFSGNPGYGTEIFNAAQIMRAAGLGQEGNVLLNLRVSAVATSYADAVIAFKYSVDNGYQPAPGRYDVPSGGANLVRANYGEQTFDMNYTDGLYAGNYPYYEGYIPQLRVTMRSGSNLRSGETMARFFRVNGAGHAYATRAQIHVQTINNRCY